ncbi:MAG: hypothetical protein ACMXYK_02360 [Candidatus Woesearchaeota archaeon]
MKKRLTHAEEFKILITVMDKFLWAALFLLVFGFYNMTTYGFDKFIQGPGYMVAGALLFSIFVIILTKEYEILK